MLNKQKNKWLILAVIVIFGYILSTEILDRYESTFGQYSKLKERENDVLKPEELMQKRTNLISKRRILTAQLTKGKGHYEQNQIGIINLINDCANEQKVIINSLIPIDSRNIGQMVEHNFRIELLGTYHRIGKLINDLETGSIPIHIQKIEIASQQPGSTTVNALIDGKAVVLSKELSR